MLLIYRRAYLIRKEKLRIRVRSCNAVLWQVKSILCRISIKAYCILIGTRLELAQEVLDRYGVRSDRLHTQVVAFIEGLLPWVCYIYKQYDRGATTS